MKLKVCGMNHNPSEVAQLRPDYLGFIFWEPSARYFSGDMPKIPSQIKKVGGIRGCRPRICFGKSAPTSIGCRTAPWKGKCRVLSTIKK